MITCYIIDDDSYAIEAVAKYIAKVPWLSVVGCNTNPILALTEILSGIAPDIVFLDVEMPELSGIELTKLLPREIVVVFTTSYRQYAYDAFQNNVTDFLLKPFSFEQFLTCVTKMREKITQQTNKAHDADRNYLFVNPGLKGKIVQIDLTDVTHVEAIEHYACIYLSKEKVVIKMSMKKIQEKLPAKAFIRVHRAYIVNIGSIKAIEANLITLKNDVQVPLGEVYRKELLNQIQG